MSKLKRKIEKNQKRKKTKEAEEKVSEKLGMFDRIPDSCLTCEKPFDKKDKKDVNSFRVVVRESENKVNLYCDTCWDSAINLIQEISKKSAKSS